MSSAFLDDIVNGYLEPDSYSFLMWQNTPGVVIWCASLLVTILSGLLLLEGWKRSKKYDQQQSASKSKFQNGDDRGDGEAIAEPESELAEQLQKAREFPKTDLSEYLQDDPVPLTQSQENLISKLKIAKQRGINKKMEEILTKQDLVNEKMAEAQQLAKVYSLLKENEDKFGNMSIDDVKEQMSMYKLD